MRVICMYAPSLLGCFKHKDRSNGVHWSKQQVGLGTGQKESHHHHYALRSIEWLFLAVWPFILWLVQQHQDVPAEQHAVWKQTAAKIVLLRSSTLEYNFKLRIISYFRFAGEPHGMREPLSVSVRVDHALAKFLCSYAPKIFGPTIPRCIRYVRTPVCMFTNQQIHSPILLLASGVIKLARIYTKIFKSWVFLHNPGRETFRTKMKTHAVPTLHFITLFLQVLNSTLPSPPHRMFQNVPPRPRRDSSGRS